MKKTILIAVIALLGIGGVAAADTDSKPLQWFADGANTGGWSHLTRLDNMVLATLEVVGLNPGDAVTLWWVVFNDPSSCSDGVCGEDDFADVSVAQISVGNATGGIVKADGTMEMGAVLREGAGEPSGHQVLFAATQSGYFLDDAALAEIHFVVQIHGQARGGKKMLEQITYFEANCTPSCADVQFAVHLAPAP